MQESHGFVVWKVVEVKSDESRAREREKERRKVRLCL
jgi:uncharacterized membrane protein